MNESQPAFPTWQDQSWGGAPPIAMGGMSLRDYFAAKAMQALISMGGVEIRQHTDEGILILPARKGIPPLAWEYADAMLAERNK